MKLIIFSFKFIIFILLISNYESANTDQKEVQDGVYNIVSKKRFSTLSYNKGLKFTKDKLGNENINFRIVQVKSGEKLNEKYYRFQHLKTQSFLAIITNKNKKDISDSVELRTELSEYNNNTDEQISFDFIITDTGNNEYTIKNKNGCFFRSDVHQLRCERKKPDEYSLFYLIKLYTEISKDNEKDQLILEKEPIDVVIK